jgi:PucR family transcriptional regulator, purine catabolism regulatory protein
VFPTLRELCRALGDDFAPVTPSPAPAVEVSAVHVSELADPTGYLDGGELLLTTGLGFRPSAVWFSAYVERLARAGVAGLALGLGPVHASVPAELVTCCERAGLPLLVVPAPTPFLTITRRYWSMIAESGQRELAEMLSTHRALVAAAVGRSPVPSVLRRLAVAIEGWAAHLSPDGRLRAVWPPSQRSAARELQSAVRSLHAVGAPTALSLPLGDDDVVVQPIGPIGSLLGYLAVGHPRPLPPKAQQLTMTAVALLTLESVHAARLRAAARNTEAVLLDLLRSGQQAAARQAAAFTGVELPGSVRVAVLLSESAADLLTGLDRLPVGADQIALAGLLDLPAASADPACCLLLDATADCAGWLRRLVSAAPGARGALGAGGPLEQLPSALRRAAAAARDAAPGEFADLGLPGRLADAGTPLDTPQLRGWAQRWLAPLGIGEDDSGHAAGMNAGGGNAGGSTLADTLAAYLRSQSEQAAARELGVHRHTVRNRLARAETLLGARLDDPDTRAELWLALRLAGCC